MRQYLISETREFKHYSSLRVKEKRQYILIMKRTEASILFLEEQFREINQILKYSRHRNTYNSRCQSILEKLEYKYMISKFTDHENTNKIMSKL